MDEAMDEAREEVAGREEERVEERHRRSLFLSPIELLCVVVVIGILGSLTWAARGTRETSICISRMKQIGLGTLQYVRDYDERMPHAGGPLKWNEQLLPYTKSPELFDCPAPGASYAMHLRLAGISLALVDAPAAMPLGFDSHLNRVGALDNGASWPTEGVHRRSLRGPWGANTLYFDGHVKWSQQKPRFDGEVLRMQLLQARWIFNRMRDKGRRFPSRGDVARPST